MILSVMQPTYIPWMGYFDLINSSDQFVFLDDVKLGKSDWHVRNRIKSAQGELMLSQVVSTPNGRMESTICDTEFKQGHPWRKKHLKAIKMNYQRAPYFDEIYDVLLRYYSVGSNNLADFNIGLIRQFMKLLDITTPVDRTSNIQGLSGKKDERLVNLCHFFSAKTYLSPLGAKNYIERYNKGGALSKAGIDVYYQQFSHPEYQQLYPPFVSHLGIIDALMNLGPEVTKLLIGKGHCKPINYKQLS